MSTESKRRGRPVVEGSARQAREAAKAAKIAAGVEIKRGRPKGSSSKGQEATA
jgi:hypothetical protein